MKIVGPGYFRVYTPGGRVVGAAQIEVTTTSKKTIEFIEAETRRLEALGIVLRNLGAVLNPDLRVNVRQKVIHAAKELELEGVIAKRNGSIYDPSRPRLRYRFLRPSTHRLTATHIP